MIKERTKIVFWYKLFWVFGAVALALGVIGIIGLLATSSPFYEFGPAIWVVIIGVILHLISRALFSLGRVHVDHTFKVLNRDEDDTIRIRFTMKEWQDLRADMERIGRMSPKFFHSKYIDPLEAIKIELRCKNPDMYRCLRTIEDFDKEIPKCIRESIQEFLDGKLSKELFEIRINMIIEMTWEASNFGD